MPAAAEPVLRPAAGLAAALPGWAWLTLAGLTALRLGIAGTAGLSPDETYYWLWSRALAPGYLDHPPMVALWIRAGTAIAGDGAIGIRLLAPIAAALGTLVLARAAADLLPDLRPSARAGLIAAALLNATLLFGVGAVTMTPDTPLLFFWTLCLGAMARLLRTGRGEWWLAAGLACGAALASKYTGFLLLGGIGLWALAAQEGRHWLWRWQPWAGLGLALLLFAPVLGWNAAHHWASFLRQGGRTEDWHPARALQFLGELIGGQFGLATPLVFVLCVVGVWHAVRRARRGDAGATLLLALTLPGAAVFLQHALGDRVQANWPAVLYPAAAIAAAAVAGRWWRPAVALGFALTALVYLQALAAPLPLPARADVTLARLAGWDGLAQAVVAAARAQHADFVTAPDYALAAPLAHDLPPGLPVIGYGPRWAYFDLPPAGATAAGRTGLLVQNARRVEAPDPARWTQVTPLGEIARGRHGRVAERYRLFRVTARPAATGLALLPRPR